MLDGYDKKVVFCILNGEINSMKNYNDLKRDLISKCCAYKTKPKLVFAIQIEQYEQFTDESGEQFIGTPGDYRVLDSKGRLFYMNKYAFRARFMADNEKALEMEVYSI